MSHTGPLSVQGLRLPILHVIGDLTVYRPSTSTCLRSILEQAVRVALRPYPDAQTCRQAEAEVWLNAWPAPRIEEERFFLDCERLSINWATPVVEECLQQLVIEGLVQETQADRWALTRESVAEAVRVRDVFTTRNVTAAWVAGTIDAVYFSKLEAHLSARCKRSEQFNEIPDLIHKFLLNLISRNGLRNMLMAGRHPSPSDIRNWVYRGALSIWRDEGRDALTRAFKGCRTEKDLRLDAETETESHQDTVARSIPSENQGVFLAEDGEGQSGSLVGVGSAAFPLLDVVGGNMEDELIHWMSGRRMLSLVEEAVRRQKRGAADRFARILAMLRGEYSLHEIGAAEGVSRNRAASLVADLRAAMQRAVASSGLAVRVLQYVRKEPYATLEDMEESEENGGMGETVDATILDALVAAGRLRRERGGCYLVTVAGERALDNEEFFGIEIEGAYP